MCFYTNIAKVTEQLFDSKNHPVMIDLIACDSDPLIPSCQRKKNYEVNYRDGAAAPRCRFSALIPLPVNQTPLPWSAAHFESLHAA